MKGLIFVYVLAYGGALVALFNPWYGFLVFMAFGILRPEALWSYAFDDAGGRGFSRTVFFCLLIGWLLRGCGSWRFGKARGAICALVAFCAWSLLSALQAKFDGAVAMEQVEQYVKIILPIFIGLTLIDSMQKLRQMAWVLLFCCGYLAWRFNEDYYWNIQDFSPAEWIFASMDSNGIALTMVATAALAFFMALNPPDCWKIPKWVLRLICLFTVATSTHVVLFSMSRGGMVALILTGFLAFLILPKRPLYLAMFAAAVLIGLRLAGASVQERFAQVFEHEKDASAVSRTVLWGQCWELMLQYPLLGIGPDNWFKWARGYWGTEKAAHTLWLHVGAEMGFPGLFFLASYYFLSTGRLLRYCFEKTPTLDPWLHTLARLVVASVVGFAIAAQFLSVQGVELPYYIALLGAGMLKIESTQASLAAAGAWASPAPYPVPYQYPVRVPMPAGPRSSYPVRS